MGDLHRTLAEAETIVEGGLKSRNRAKLGMPCSLDHRWRDSIGMGRRGKEPGWTWRESVRTGQACPDRKGKDNEQKNTCQPPAL